MISPGAVKSLVSYLPMKNTEADLEELYSFENVSEIEMGQIFNSFDFTKFPKLKALITSDEYFINNNPKFREIIQHLYLKRELNQGLVESHLPILPYLKTLKMDSFYIEENMNFSVLFPTLEELDLELCMFNNQSALKTLALLPNFTRLRLSNILEEDQFNIKPIKFEDFLPALINLKDLSLKNFSGWTMAWVNLINLSSLSNLSSLRSLIIIDSTVINFETIEKLSLDILVLKGNKYPNSNLDSGENKKKTQEILERLQERVQYFTFEK